MWTFLSYVNIYVTEHHLQRCLNELQSCAGTGCFRNHCVPQTFLLDTRLPIVELCHRLQSVILVALLVHEDLQLTVHLDLLLVACPIHNF